jgi:hypothetical protein
MFRSSIASPARSLTISMDVTRDLGDVMLYIHGYRARRWKHHRPTPWISHATIGCSPSTTAELSITSMDVICDVGRLSRDLREVEHHIHGYQTRRWQRYPLHPWISSSSTATSSSISMEVSLDDGRVTRDVSGLADHIHGIDLPRTRVDSTGIQNKSLPSMTSSRNRSTRGSADGRTRGVRPFSEE